MKKAFRRRELLSWPFRAWILLHRKGIPEWKAQAKGWGGERNRQESFWLAPWDKQKLAAWEQRLANWLGSNSCRPSMLIQRVRRVLLCGWLNPWKVKKSSYLLPHVWAWLSWGVLLFLCLLSLHHSSWTFPSTAWRRRPSVTWGFCHISVSCSSQAMASPLCHPVWLLQNSKSHIPESVPCVSLLSTSIQRNSPKQF